MGDKTGITWTDATFSLEHSQFSEDRGLFPFHIGPLDNAIEHNLIDCIHNNRKGNKWQIVFAGSFDECQKTMEKIIKTKGLSEKNKRATKDVPRVSASADS